MLPPRTHATRETLFYAIAACVATGTSATAFVEVKSEFVARFLLEVIDVPMETVSRSRRLQGIELDDSMADATPGELISSLLHAAVNGSLATSGRRLSTSGYIPKYPAAAALAKFVDITMDSNDRGCDYGTSGQRLAEEKQADEAIKETKKGLRSISDGQTSNGHTIEIVKKLPSHPARKKMLDFLGGWVVKTLSGNHGLLEKSLGWCEKLLRGFSKFAVGMVKKAVGGLKWVGPKIGHFFGLYDVRGLQAAIGAPKAVAALPAPSSITPTMKVPMFAKIPIVMVAGMVTALALLVAGMRQWKKRGNSVGSMEADTVLAVE